MTGSAPASAGLPLRRGARLGDVRIETSVEDRDTNDANDANDANGRVAIDVSVIASHTLVDALDTAIECVLTDDRGIVVASRRTELTLVADRTVTTSSAIDARGVRRWWPRTLGTPTCYRLAVRLVADGVELDHWSGTVGFRTVELDTASDPLGSAFTFVVNDVPLFTRGVVWTPGEPMASPAARSTARRRLHEACAANIDLVRVWGGGVHESDDFYDACDELGLLVWQDLPFAGTSYPERLLRDEVRTETRDNVARLHHHPSLVLWNGNDECQQGHADGAWEQSLHERAWGEGFWTDDVPLVLEELDPSRPYWPSSPYSGPRLRPDADLHGTSHVWTGWERATVAAVRGRACRFVAALGGNPPATSLPRGAELPAVALARAAEQLRLATPADGDDRTDRHDRTGRSLAAEIVRARTARTAIEYFRSLRGHCMGTIWWQLVDDEVEHPTVLHPTATGALLDHDGRRTPAWYAVRDAYVDRLATVQPRGHELVLHLVNDSSQGWRVEGCAERLGLDGTVRYAQPVGAVVAPRSIARITLDACVASPRDPSAEVLVVDVGHTDAWWWFADDVPTSSRTTDARRASGGPAICLEVDVVGRSAERLVVDVTADAVVRDLVIALDRLGPDAGVDRQLVSLRPGRPERFTITGLTGLTGLTGDDVGDAWRALVSDSLSWTS